MLVLSMNSKRQRRPNVRLGEIGDIPAAFACGFSLKSMEHLGHKRYKNDFLDQIEAEHNPICELEKQKAADYEYLVPGLSPRISTALQQNRENKNPNSSKSAFDLVSSDEFDVTKSGLCFGKITRKSRVMKRRGRSIQVNSNFLGNVWSSTLSPPSSNENGKDTGVKEFVVDAFNGFNGCYSDNGLKDLSDQETPTVSKEVSDMDEPAYDVRQKEAYYEQEAACYGGNIDSPASDNAGDVNIVMKWLEERGFGKYADLFKMHEVDEEALLLLTVEDLKEIGVFAVGARRKLYTAIQQLRRGDVSTWHEDKVH